MPFKIHVKNFQSIADAEVEVEGFTVVTGSNNSGKTALMRAVRGVFQNTSGNRFVRHGEDKCEVTIADGDHTVKWEKGKKQKPKYTIDGKEIYPGRDIPVELSCMNVSPIRCNGRDIWPQIAPQFQQIFLLDENGSSIAEALADIERVGKLNRALKKVNTDRKALASELRVRSTDKIEYEKRLKNFDGLDDLLSQFEIIEQAHTQIQKDKQQIEQLHTLLEQYNDALCEVEELQGIDTIEVPERSEIVEVAEQGKQCRKIAQLLVDYNVATQELESLEGAVLAIKLPPKQDFVSINEQRISIKDLIDLKDQYEEAQQSLQEVEEDIHDVQTQLQAAEKEVKDLLREAKVCPTCGSQCSGHFMDQIFGGQG